MSKTTKEVSAADLIGVTLPVKTETYTVISHGFIIDEVRNALRRAGFEIMSEQYRANNNLEVARGSYIIKRSEDPSFMMSFSWVNSYDKSTKFQCAVGGYIWENNSFVIEKEDNTFIRKHTGDADTLAKETIADKIANAEKYYKSVLDAKHKMENVKLTRSQVAKILGELYFSYDILSIEQLSGIKKEYTKPSYVYSSEADSLWITYCHILTILKSSHPKLWLQQQSFVHNYLKINYLMLTDPMIAPAPGSLMDTLLKAPELPIGDIEEEGKNVPEKIIPKFSILTEEEAEEELLTMEELESEQILEKTAYPLTPEDAFVSAKTIVMDLSDPESTPELLDDYLERINDETVQYTDPVGNTFEAPVVSESFMDEFSEEEIADVEEAKELLTQSDNDNTIITDPKIVSILSEQVNNIFGEEVDITVYLKGENYNVVTNDEQEVIVPVNYLNTLL